MPQQTNKPPWDSTPKMPPIPWPKPSKKLKSTPGDAIRTTTSSSTQQGVPLNLIRHSHHGSIQMDIICMQYKNHGFLFTASSHLIRKHS
jgi:hypothetical protein